MIVHRIRNGGDPIEVQRVHVHSLNYTYSDIALFKLKTKLDYNLGILPICLPEPVSIAKVLKIQCIEKSI